MDRGDDHRDLRHLPHPEVARLGQTLRHWKQTCLAYFTTDRSANGGAEAVNGIIEFRWHIARGYPLLAAAREPHGRGGEG